MTNSFKPTIKSRIKIPAPMYNIWQPRRQQGALPEVLTLKVMQSVAYPVKDKQDLARKQARVQKLRSNDLDFVTRVVFESGKRMFRVWRTV